MDNEKYSNDDWYKKPEAYQIAATGTFCEMYYRLIMKKSTHSIVRVNLNQGIGIA